MDSGVVNFNQISDAQIRRAGGKGGTLAKLAQAGYPVPDGFVVLPEAFEGSQLKDSAWVQVQQLLDHMRNSGENGKGFAVRSSALSEDSAAASFAGEFETRLDLHTDRAVQEALHAVRASRASTRVQVYSQAQGIDTRHEIAVVVQQMVPAVISGVLFTADPVSGSRSRMVGNFVYGAGEQLVSGAADAHTFTFHRPRGRYEGPPALRPFQKKLYRLAARLETELGGPQDIEWVVDGAGLYLLQSRPITTLSGYNQAAGEYNATRTGDYLWSNVNFGEAVTQPMTPLAWSVLQFTLEDWVFIPGFSMVGNIGGYPYLNISVLASLFHALGRDRQVLLQTMEGTLYMRLPDTLEIPLIPLSWWDTLRSLSCLFKVGMNQRRGQQRLSAYLDTNPAWFEEMRAALGAVENPVALRTLWETAIRAHVKQGAFTVLGTASHSADYTIQLRRDLAALVGPADASTLIANVSAGKDSLASLRLLDGLSKVARGEQDREAYLAQNGHRGPHEFEISIPRPVEAPAWFDEQIQHFRENPVDVAALLARQREAFAAAWDRFQTRFPRQAGKFQRRLAESARRAKLRELARSEYVRDRWLVRLFALRAGELTDLGADIFFLTLPEVLDVLSGGPVPAAEVPVRKVAHQKNLSRPAFPPVICGRFDPDLWLADPQRPQDVFDAHVPVRGYSGADLNTVLGSPGAAGQVEGVVRVLLDPDDGEQLQTGEILVTTQTDIAWTLLFPRAGAVITDIGAPLSHAAIVARELGIPAVVGCGDATTRLKTGTRVRIDGSRGTVTLLE